MERSDGPVWAVLVEAAGEIEAGMLRHLLEDHGIPVLIQPLGLTTVILGARAPVRVSVPADRLDEARRLVQALRWPVDYSSAT